MKEDSNENKHRENREKALWLATKQYDARPRIGLWQLDGWIWWYAWIPALIALAERDVWLVIATYGNEYGRKLHGPAVDG